MCQDHIDHVLFSEIYPLSVKQSVDSEEDSDEDTGFYSEGEGPVPPRRRSSGLCVAFRFPVKKNSALKTPSAAADEPQNARPAPEKSKGVEQRQRRPRAVAQPISRPQRAVAQPISKPQRAVVKAKGRAKELSEEDEDENVKESEGEEELSEVDMQALNKRAKNIQENKAMVRNTLIAHGDTTPRCKTRALCLCALQYAPTVRCINYQWNWIH